MVEGFKPSVFCQKRMWISEESRWTGLKNQLCPFIRLSRLRALRRWTWTGEFKCREVKTGFCRNRSMQTGSSGTLIGWKSGETTFVPLWDWMEGAWLRTLKATPRVTDRVSPFRLKIFFASKRIVSEQRSVSHEIRLFASSIRFPFFRFFRLFSLQIFRNFSL